MNDSYYCTKTLLMSSGHRNYPQSLFNMPLTHLQHFDSTLHFPIRLGMISPSKLNLRTKPFFE